MFASGGSFERFFMISYLDEEILVSLLNILLRMVRETEIVALTEFYPLLVVFSRR